MFSPKQTGLTVALVAGGVAPRPGSAFSGCTPAAIRPPTGNPGKDKIGLACDPDDTGSISGMTAPGLRSVVQVGGATGSPEKDTFGYVQAPAAGYAQAPTAQ